MYKRLSFAGWILAISLAACSGGGGSTPPVSGATSSPPGTAHFTISDPYNTTQARRKPAYFSTATAAILITINGSSVQLDLSPTSSGCTISGSTIACAVDVPVPNGPITYTVQTLDSTNHPLSQATGTATINGKTAVPLTLEGIWQSATVRLANEHPLMGSPSTINVTVSGYDNDSALIIGPEPYTSPIPLYNTDTTGATSLSTTSVTHPGQSVTLTYDGTSYVNPMIGPGESAGQINGDQDTLVPSISVVEYPIPSGNIAANGAGHGRMIVNADNSISFIEQRLHLGRVTMSGTVTETTLPTWYYDIAKGADGNLWALAQTCYPNCTGQDNNAVERINSDGTVTPLPMFPYYAGSTVLTGSDGNFWTPAGVGGGAATAGIERMTRTGVETTFTLSGVQGLVDGVLAGDGNLWYSATKNYAGEFVRVAPDGTFTEFPLPSADVGCCNGLGNVALGPDGQIYSILGTQIERISTSGAISHLPSSGFLNNMNFYALSINTALGFGPDGALWVSGPGTAYCSPEVERITTSGSWAILQLNVPCNSMNGPLPPVLSFVAGPDGNLWYTRDRFVGKIILH